MKNYSEVTKAQEEKVIVFREALHKLIEESWMIGMCFFMTPAEDAIDEDWIKQSPYCAWRLRILEWEWFDIQDKWTLLTEIFDFCHENDVMKVVWMMKVVEWLKNKTTASDKSEK